MSIGNNYLAANVHGLGKHYGHAGDESMIIINGARFLLCGKCHVSQAVCGRLVDGYRYHIE